MNGDSSNLFPIQNAALIRTALVQSLALAQSAVACILVICPAPPWARAGDVAMTRAEKVSLEFVNEHCLDCHTGEDAEAGFDIENIGADLSEADVLHGWVKIFDRVAAGEMPPPDSATIPAERREQFLSGVERSIRTFQNREQQQQGRVRGKRLTNLQLERTLQHLLKIDIPLAREMPDEPKTGTYSTIAANQSISHFQLEQHLKIVDLALDEAFRRALTPGDENRVEFTAEQISRTRPRTREPEFIGGAAVVWSGQLTFYGRLPATTANQSGWYRFKLQAAALKKPKDRGVWCTVQSGKCVSSAPLMSWVSSFETTEEPEIVTFDTWLPAGHMLEVRPGDKTLKRARFKGGQSENGEGGAQDVPGVKIDWLTMERIHVGAGDQQVRKTLFGDLPVDVAKSTQNGFVKSDAPKVDGHRLIARFADKAFRRPIDSEGLERFNAIFDEALRADENFVRALQAAYRAILCSARFLYFTEEPGELDDYAIASRLSYFLWNSMPDERLFQLARAGKLTEPNVLRHQVVRMLETKRGKRFVPDFAHQWLELSEIDFTEPDGRLHPDYDKVVQYASLDETETFLQHLIKNDLSVSKLIDCDYTFLNSRLARFYGIEGVEGDELRRVDVDEASQRGGLMAQSAILKVTANGTNTSPVIRGVWVSRRLLGVDIPPPPDNVPAIEPDIRGAKSIREQLEKHKSQDECASCHRKIDPPGFSLENFDAAGKWREHYPKVVSKRVLDGAKIDPGYVTPDGKAFSSFSEFRSLAASDKEALARNVARQLVAYGTGAEVSFADRQEIEHIVKRASKSDYGFRSIIQAVVTSRLFLNK